MMTWRKGDETGMFIYTRWQSIYYQFATFLFFSSPTPPVSCGFFIFIFIFLMPSSVLSLDIMVKVRKETLKLNLIMSSVKMLKSINFKKSYNGT